MSPRWALFCLCAVLATLAPRRAGAWKAMRYAKSDGSFWVTFPYEDVCFAQPIDTRQTRVLHLSEPPDACSPLTNKGIEGQNSPVALIKKGACALDEKVRRAQDAGFTAVIIFDDKVDKRLVKMPGDPTGIRIPAVIVTKEAGEALKALTGSHDMELFIIPVVPPLQTFLSLLPHGSGTLLVVVSICVIVVLACLTPERSVKDQTFSSAVDEKSTSVTCTICLDDYVYGDKLSVLPCQHRFHIHCLDKWLCLKESSWNQSCPVCKQSFVRPMHTAETRTSPSLSSPPPPGRPPILRDIQFLENIIELLELLGNLDLRERHYRLPRLEAT